MQATDTPENQPALNQIQRVVNALIAPANTFQDIKRSAAWWFPFLIVTVVSTIFSIVILNKVGLPTLIDGIIAHSPRLTDRIANDPSLEPPIRATIARFLNILYAGPVISIIAALVVGGLFLGTTNFIFGGRAKFGQMIAVWYYGSLPLQIYFLLVVIYAATGLASENFFINNPIGTNIGFYFDAGNLPAPLIAFLTAIDIFSIWTACLLTIGLSVVAEIKRSSAAIVVVGWWTVLIGFRVLGALLGN